MKSRSPSQCMRGGFTLVEMLVAIAIFVIAVLAILQLVNQNMQLILAMQKQRPDLGALAGNTMMEPVQPDGTLTLGPVTPEDEDFGYNGGGRDTLYPNALWERDLEAIDATNGLYRATITVTEQDNDGEELKITLSFLMFRPDLAEAEQAGNTR